MTSEARGAARSRSRGWLSRLRKQSVAVSRPGWLDYCAAQLARVNRNKCGDWTVSSVTSYSTRQRGEDKKYIHNKCLTCSLKVLVIWLKARKLVVSRPPLFTKAKTNLYHLLGHKQIEHQGERGYLYFSSSRMINVLHKWLFPCQTDRAIIHSLPLVVKFHLGEWLRLKIAKVLV